jgi:hypothetical protein
MSHSTPTRAVTRIAARLLAASLDSQLAAGVRPDSGPLLAARAHALAGKTVRRELADNWEALLERVIEGRPLGRMQASPDRDRILAAEPAIRRVTCALRQGCISGEGIAIASDLLADGTGPVFNRHSTLELRQVLLSTLDSPETPGRDRTQPPLTIA